MTHDDFPTVNLREVHFLRLPMKTRFPFRYGIASMTEAPHLFVCATVETNEQRVRGISSDGLPPKWFTKNVETTFEEDDLPSMLRVIRHASDVAQDVGQPSSFFDWWRRVYDTQHDWAAKENIPPLLAGFGVSLIERAVLDALCRSLSVSLFTAIRSNCLGIELGAIRPALKSLRPSDVLPAAPLNELAIRHTIGLGDPLSQGDVSQEDRPDDGLPFTLEENIAVYGLRYFKIKLSGNHDVDRARLVEIANIINRQVGPEAKCTLDGNENFQTIAQFRDTWSNLLNSQELRDFFGRSLLFVEQPVHRSRALAETVGGEVRSWPDAPPIIIDESDADLNSLPNALSLGYSGTSHKNCKGIIKGLLGAATIRQVGSAEKVKPLILSAEDLGNVGPVALLQDLAMVATLGISHVERNGHHYFAGLSMYPDELQELAIQEHPDLYSRSRTGFPALSPQDGALSLHSVNHAPFGVSGRFDADCLESWFDDWDF